MTFVSKITFILFFLIVLGGCLNSGSHTTEGREITIELVNFKITPEKITIKRGETVELTVVNNDGEHNLFIEDYNLRTEVSIAKDTQIIGFVANRSGTFGYWCEVRDHRERGMEGQLIVK